MRGKRCVSRRLGPPLGLTAAVLAPVAWAGGGVPAQPAAPVARTAWAAAPADPGDPGAPGAPAGREAADGAVPAVGRVWPVGTRPPVLRGWEPPATPYGPGHRGVDLGVPPGAPVRTAAAGRVSFAGLVAGRGVVSVELAGTGAPPLRTTYEPVRATVRQGEEVTAGEVIGTVEASGSHCGSGCLHWGLLRGGTYLDPLLLLPPRLLNPAPSRLLPVPGAPLPRALRLVEPG
ncbi:murein hydrolase activator EnvC family protein [Streptomyces sp. NPDC015220]|uniref:murein hydrolase activator EnvC family protein n=1 Tax=Streptomyces sp. NPDC015220 TaxID=3364947 RepID=UPI0036FD03AD